MSPEVRNLLDLLWPGLAAGAAAGTLLPWLKRDWPMARAVMLAIGAALILRYVIWRGVETLPPPGANLDLLTGIVFYAVETIALLGAILNALFLSRTRSRSTDSDRNASWFAEQHPAPLVDVLICTYNEDEEILERTIIGAMAMNYGRFRVWVCDDGRRAWLRELCQRCGCAYLTRPDSKHAKAGNINHALGVLAAQVERPQFISILDADFVPRANFLRRTLPLFRDPAIGIVQTPQHFINPDPIQSNLSASAAWPDEQRYFFDVLMASKDAWGAAFCCGTSSVLRFEPLFAMGGFPTDSVTEDYLVTLRMKERGLGTAYLNEALSLGLAPEGIKEYITQRGRWCLGFIQICRGRSGPFSVTSNLNLIDRLSLIDGFISWVFVYTYRVLGTIIPTLYLMFGIKALNADLRDLLHYFLPLFVWNTMVVGWIGQCRILPVMTDVCHLIAAPTILKSVAVGLFRPHNQRFKVTAKGGDRSRRFVEWPLMRFCLLLLLLTVAGVLISLMTSRNVDYGGGGAMALVWGWYNIVVLTVACFVCIEMPRRRRSERVPMTGRAMVVCDDGPAFAGELADISILGARLLGRCLTPAGSRMTLRFKELAIPGEVVRAGTREFALRFDDTSEVRAAMIRFTYGQAQAPVFTMVRPSRLGLAVLQRLFR